METAVTKAMTSMPASQLSGWTRYTHGRRHTSMLGCRTAETGLKRGNRPAWKIKSFHLQAGVQASYAIP